KILYSQYLQNANPNFGKGYGAEYGFRAYYNLNKNTKIFLENINEEKDIDKYLEKINRKDYTIFISVKDDASKNISKKTIQNMANLGLIVDLNKTLRNSYKACIDEGKVVYEEEGNTNIVYEGILDRNNIYIESSGYTVGNNSSIKINNKELS